MWHTHPTLYHPKIPNPGKSHKRYWSNGIGRTANVRSLTNGKGEAVEREREAVELAKSHKRKWSNSSFTNGIVGLHNNNDNVVASDAGRTRTSDPWDTRAPPTTGQTVDMTYSLVSCGNHRAPERQSLVFEGRNRHGRREGAPYRYKLACLEVSQTVERLFWKVSQTDSKR
jgi:hypothetical protein